MTTHARWPWRCVPRRCSIHGLCALQWPTSISVNLLIAGAIGSLYILLVLGLPRLDPTNISWLDGDPAQYYIAWQLFRQDPHLHWPLTFTERVGYPLGDSIAFMDPMPWFVLLFKPLSPLLPRSFQYLGLAAVIAASLQFFFAARLFQQLLGRQVFVVLIPGFFFLMAPPMTWRLWTHYALANHWLIIAALCLFISLQRADGKNIRRLTFYYGLLAGVSVGVTPYLTVMVLVVLGTGVISAWWRQRLSFKAITAIIVVMGVACLIPAIAFGLVRGDGGYGGDGYRGYSMNLLAPIDPGTFGALFLPPLPQFSLLQYEGYNYLGTGVLILAVMLMPSCWRRRWRRFTAAKVVPLTLACVVLTALALSTKVTAGSMLVADLDPHEVLTNYLAVFRSSGRLFWVPYYVILAAILSIGFRVWRWRTAVVLITVALVVQYADTIPLRRAVRAHVNQVQPLPFHAPQWSWLGQEHANLLVLPPWQCFVARGAETPGGREGFRIFGLLAVSQHMRTNSYYAARYSPASLAFHCDQAVGELLKNPLSQDSAYVVSPSVARIIAAGPTGPSACHRLDEFILCSIQTDFGLGPGAAP